MQHVVVSGIPGSGKTTIGRRLARHLAIPFLDKDDFLEAAFEVAEVPDRAARRVLSRQADVDFARAAREQHAVLVSHWRHPSLGLASGTPTDWLVDAVELHVVCPPEIAAARFAVRRRHPFHFDPNGVTDDLLEGLVALAEAGPLGVGPVVSVDSGGGVPEIDEIAQRIVAASRGAST